MRREEITSDLTGIAFDFFYWFSRFEFCLKENGYLKSFELGVAAEAGWRPFIDKWADGYTPSREAHILLASPPARQLLDNAKQLVWRPVGLSDCTSDLARVVRLVCTVRNNLFHGGKHGAADWDLVDRTKTLLEASRAVLDQFADLSTMHADYLRHY